MNKHYKLIVSGNNFSLSNETDSDIQSDYSPGIWAISTQVSTLKFARSILAEGNTIEVTNYRNPSLNKLANYFIKELGLKQELFPEPKELEPSRVTNGKPSTLGAFKKYLQPGMKFEINRVWMEEGREDKVRTTEVLKVGSTSFTVKKSLENPSPSWIYFGKASEWGFSNEEATQYSVSRETGEMEPLVTFKYL